MLDGHDINVAPYMEQHGLTPFTFDTLKRIISDREAPIIYDTFNAREIIFKVNIILADRKIPKEEPPNEIKTLKKKITKTEEACDILLDAIPHLIRAKQRCLAASRVADPRPPGALYYEEIEVSRLESAHEALLEARALLAWGPKRQPGQHGSPALQDSSVPTEIFCRLHWAWEEADQKPAPKEKRYEIVSDCLAWAGINVSTDTIRKAVNKVLLKYKDEYQEFLDGNKIIGRK